MSVTDPLIKDIKACASKFLDDLKNSKTTGDSCTDLLVFCQCVEKAFGYGLIAKEKTLGFVRYIDAWSLMEKIANGRHELINYAFSNSAEIVRKQPALTTNSGRLRLLIRFCLAKRCLHVPLNYLIKTGKIAAFYKANSIIGDEILAEILLSVFLQCGKMNFDLDLANCSFLDHTWQLPQVLRLELVPCKSLGIGVSFSNEKAVIVDLKSNSVISENNVEVGDILDNLNGVHICSSTKGRLNSILQSSKCRPVTLTIIKAINSETKEIYAPLIKFLKEVHVDPVELRNRHSRDEVDEKSGVKSNSAGFKVTYVGKVQVGKHGDVRQIDKAFREILVSPLCGDKCHLVGARVFFEIGEIGVKIVDEESSDVVLRHSYMEISSCGSSQQNFNYFAYVCGDANSCNEAKLFTCYVFHCASPENVFTILQSLGQGFHRTHFAV